MDLSSTSTSNFSFTSAYDNQTLVEECFSVTIPRSLEVLPMRVSAHPTDPTVNKAQATTFLNRILDNPNLSGVDFPASIKGYLYIDDVPHLLQHGTWTVSDGIIYLARSGSLVEPLTRLSILACIAGMTSAIDSPGIADKLSTRLVAAVADSVRSVYGGIVRSAQRPSRLAINTVMAQVAAEINGAWFTTSGAPVEVNDTWIVMDF